MLTVTNPVGIDQQEVSSLVGTLKNLSLGSIIKILLLFVTALYVIAFIIVIIKTWMV